MSSGTPFEVSVSDAVLADLSQRLSQARVPVGVAKVDGTDAGKDPNGAWAQGTDPATLLSWVEYWKTEFLPAWTSHEASINKLPHFMLQVDDLDMHYIFARSSSPTAIPLLLVHGWPGSVVEFLDVIPLLTTPVDGQAFHVIAPSLPGFAWSQAPATADADIGFMADRLHNLMSKLGFAQYCTQGGDWGSLIGSTIAARYPSHCVALHVNLVLPAPSGDHFATAALIATVALQRFTLSSEEREDMRQTMYFAKHEDAYQRIQGTKPQSLGVGLNDSPVGLLAWHLEKFQSWGDNMVCGPEGPTGADQTRLRDAILTNVMVYWTTQSITSSMRIYYATFGHRPGGTPPLVPYSPVPTGCLVAQDLIRPPRSLAARTYNLRSYVRIKQGGHFFALERPHALAQELRTFFFQRIDFTTCCEKPAKKSARPMTAVEVGLYALLLAVGAACVRAVWLKASL